MVGEGRAAQIPKTIAINVVATNAVLIEKRLNDGVTCFHRFSRITLAITGRPPEESSIASSGSYCRSVCIALLSAVCLVWRKPGRVSGKQRRAATKLNQPGLRPLRWQCRRSNSRLQTDRQRTLLLRVPIAARESQHRGSIRICVPKTAWRSQHGDSANISVPMTRITSAISGRREWTLHFQKPHLRRSVASLGSPQLCEVVDRHRNVPKTPAHRVIQQRRDECRTRHPPPVGGELL